MLRKSSPVGVEVSTPSRRNTVSTPAARSARSIRASGFSRPARRTACAARMAVSRP